MDSKWNYIGLHFITFIYSTSGLGTLWSEWWTYSGVSGPKYWGIHNLDWSICNNGKYQSPINIDPKTLVYDPHLAPINVSDHNVGAIFINNGHDLSIVINNTKDDPFIMTGGPLSYKYTLFDIKLHFGEDNTRGSEHSIGGNMFPLEIQIFGYNSDIHKNSSSASNSPHGIAAFAVFVQVTSEDNHNLDLLIKLALEVRVKGMTISMSEFPLSNILPSTDSFMTYEGSLTRPGCMETVTWIILNKPIHISYRQIESLRTLTYQDGSGQTLMENNYRSLMPNHGRLVRTNIKPKMKADDCHNMKSTSYEVNSKFKDGV